MKKLIFLSMLLIIALSTIVYSGSGSYTTTDTWYYQENADQTNFTDNGHSNPSDHSWGNFTDGDWDTYASVNGTYYMNYSKKVDDFTYISLWQNKYNVSDGERYANESIPLACWNYDETKVILKVNTTSTSNARYCYDGSWEEVGTVRNKQAIYEEALRWRVVGRTYTISYNTDKPAEYATFDNAAVNFSVYINDSLADANHTTFNCSLYTKLSSTAAYVVNVSDLIIVNGSSVNATINFNDGDRVWWYWGCEDNYSRAVFNTSVRVLDVDLVYNKLSLGANKVINFSTDTGEMVIKGGMTVANLTLTGNGDQFNFNFTKEIEINPTALTLAGISVPTRETVYNYQTLAFMNNTIQDFMVNLQLPPDYKNDTSLLINVLWAPNSSNSGNVSWCVNNTFTTEDVNESINMTSIEKCVFDETKQQRYALHRTPDITINASGMTNEDILGLKFWRNLTNRASDYGNGTYFIGASIKYTSYRLGSR